MESFNDYFDSLFVNESEKGEIKNTFKLPIQYSKHKELDPIILQDIELTGDTSDNKFNCLLNNKSEFNFLISEYTKYYSTSKTYLKDTQKLLKNIKFEDFDVSNCEYNCVKTLSEYNSFLKETSFDDKYQYITLKYLRHFNHNPVVLQYMGYYNLSTPVLSLATPLFILIVPYFVLRFKGIRITLTTYVSMIKQIIMRSSIVRGIMNFNTGSLNEKATSIVSIIFYIYQIYSNVKSCISFYNNLNDMYEFIQSYKSYLSYSINNMESLQSNIEKLKTYSEFYNDIEVNKNVLIKTRNKLNYVFSYDNVFSKLAQMGMLLKLNYELYYDEKHLSCYQYSIHLNQYVHDIKKINNLIKQNKINKREFKNKKKMTGMYYLPHIENSSKVCNDIDIKKNIIVTGPNASGKTTLIKSLLINLIMSQQWGYGCFESCSMKIYDNFYSYLNIPDTSNRDSLFQAEARRCKNIIEKINDTHVRDKETTFCIFDEIYSGTNPVDATLCATAYLKAMNIYKKSCDFILTTHYTELCENMDKEKDISKYENAYNSR